MLSKTFLEDSSLSFALFLRDLPSSFNFFMKNLLACEAFFWLLFLAKKPMIAPAPITISTLLTINHVGFEFEIFIAYLRFDG